MQYSRPNELLALLSPWPARITDLARDMQCTPDQVVSASTRLQRRFDVIFDKGRLSLAPHHLSRAQAVAGRYVQERDATTCGERATP